MTELNWTGERLVTSVPEDFLVYEHLHRYAVCTDLCKGKTVLDIACGEGYGSYLMSMNAAFVYGVDIDAATVAHADKKYSSLKNNIAFKQGSVTNIPLEDKSVDLVVSFETLEHIAEHEQMMKEVKRVLRSRGMFVVSTPDKPVYNKRSPNNPFHVKELDTESLRQLLQGFFQHCQLYKQCRFSGSLIVPENNNAVGFTTYDGDYTSISHSMKEEHGFNIFYFNIAVCSDVPLSEIEISSVFNGAAAIAREKELLAEKTRSYIQKSSSYKLGNWFIRRLSFLKNKKQK